MPATVTCIIPAYNEAPRIGAVLNCVLSCADVTEVLVVDDGSTDGTADVAEAISAPHLKILRQPQNSGKSAAVARGIEAARGEFLLFLDSDLIGLTPQAISALLAPVLTGRADAALSLRRNAPRLWHVLGIDYISGERVMPRAMLPPHLNRIRTLPGFGLEVFINRLWLNDAVRLEVVYWPDVISPFKHAKHGLWSGLRADMGMLRDMFRAVRPDQAARQIFALRAARI